MTKEDQDILIGFMERLAVNRGRAVLVVREDDRKPLKECCIYSSFRTVERHEVISAIMTLTGGITKLFNSAEM